MKLKSSLPKEQKNGLDAIHSEAIKNPTKKHLIIAVVDAAEVKEYPDREATFEILRIEAVPEEHQEVIAALLENIFETRTGSTRLDLGIEDELDMRNAFKKKAKTPRQRKDPDIFKQPELGATVTPIKGKADEDVVDAEIVEDEPGETEPDDEETEPADSETPEPENETPGSDEE